ncbi:hypothetical protein IYX23_10805 [Methylocystis sp. L43]|jgi:hypothetical protein|uniref:hypothetical protein n=1 Tax=unclassified Methylocystis TaxID=2625913 RepID=UPI0018C203E5|nr:MULTISPECIES: hypothetical protein [unclassified Methylocystis]MBG0798160.1 hypothetical protein [Methylocystis sp. L43]MBG0805755.1 hypothetical protein [Methylocystis sp. H15]
MEAVSTKYIDHVDVLLGRFPAVKASWYSHSMGGGFRDTVGYNALITECYQLLKNVHRSNHPDVQRTVQAINGESLHHLEVIEGILIGLRNNLTNELLDSLVRQISIDLKADFLEAARSLLDEDQKDPAAVLACVVLEDTLKRLAKKHGIEGAGSREMSVVAQSLLSKGVIEKSTNQSISSFKNLRNAALHAQWLEVSKESVTLLLSFLPAFIEKHGL